jgi:hypothetical protein
MISVFKQAGSAAGENRCPRVKQLISGKKMQKSHFFVSRKQNFFHPSAIIGPVMNEFVKWLGCSGRISLMSPMDLIPADLEPVRHRNVK